MNESSTAPVPIDPPPADPRSRRAGSRSGSADTRPLNALTVDVEDYFHVEAFRAVVDAAAWETYPLRVEKNTHRLLDLFDREQVKGTFFVLGWVARQRPRLIAEIARRGHEIGCHSYWHRRIDRLGPGEFRADTLEATRRIEDAGGQPVRAYRAPSFSVVPASTWALDILAELGYTTDSSIFPIRHDIYGFPGFPRHAVLARLESGRCITEVPMSTWRFLGSNLPGPGGGYLRIFPLAYSRHALRWIERREGRPAMIYLHPWEVDPAQPRLRGPLKSRLRHYTGLGRTEGRLTKLLREFPFAPLAQVLERHPAREEHLIPARHAKT